MLLCKVDFCWRVGLYGSRITRYSMYQKLKSIRCCCYKTCFSHFSTPPPFLASTCFLTLHPNPLIPIHFWSIAIRIPIISLNIFLLSFWYFHYANVGLIADTFLWGSVHFSSFFFLFVLQISQSLLICFHVCGFIHQIKFTFAFCWIVFINPKPPAPQNVTLFGNRLVFQMALAKLRWGHGGIGWARSQCEWCPYK